MNVEGSGRFFRKIRTPAEIRAKNLQNKGLHGVTLFIAWRAFSDVLGSYRF
jgi:hypothetical protein